MTLTQGPFKRLVVTGDVIRPQPDAAVAHQNQNIDWLFAALDQPLREATGIAPVRIGWREGGFDAAAFYRILGLEPTIASWARLYHETECGSQAEDYVLSHFSDALVIAFELNPLFAAIFERNGIAFVNLIIHPVRFLDDLIFGMCTNELAIFDVLAARRAPEALFQVIAGLHRAAAVRDPRPLIAEPTVLIVGQTMQDKSLIADGRFLTLADYADRIDQLAEPGARVLFKPHPYQRAIDPAMAQLVARRRIGTTFANIYRLLAQENLAAVYAISSSVCYEARYFGKRVDFFHRAPYDFADGDNATFAHDLYVAIAESPLEPDFWRAVLAPFIPTTKPSGPVLPAKPNRLRVSLREFWGYSPIDTDVATAHFFANDEGLYERDVLRYLRRARLRRLLRLFGLG
ncbi:MAG: hypothetical protein O7B81_16870 [Gammaproteobacteria bacterium]|nr:hypothetical protein [Gammaproteobacteria bacterium]